MSFGKELRMVGEYTETGTLFGMELEGRLWCDEIKMKLNENCVKIKIKWIENWSKIKIKWVENWLKIKLK